MNHGHREGEIETAPIGFGRETGLLSKTIQSFFGRVEWPLGPKELTVLAGEWQSYRGTEFE